MKQTFSIFTFILLFWTMQSCSIYRPSHQPIVEIREIPVAKPNVLTGIDVLAGDGFSILHGKSVGLITNATGVNRDLVSTIDLLYNAENVRLVALFGPEHGVRGTEPAGSKIASTIDKKTGLQVYSLYGDNRKPTREMLEGIDVLVYDIQDVGCRSYTYITTMGLCMEACAENGIPFIVLDRPNPLGGYRIEGNIVEPDFTSFVGRYPIPYVYGLTPGELALYLNGEYLLGDSLQCDVTVVPMNDWKREMTFEETGLEWVPTSPHVPHRFSPFYYVSSGVMGELGIISEGVGYTAPFQFIGAPWVNEDSLAMALHNLGLNGVRFRPVLYTPYYGRDAGTPIHGVQVHIMDPTKVNLLNLQFYYLETLIRLYPNRNPFQMASEDRLRMFDKVMGSAQVRKLFSVQYKVEDILPFFNKDIGWYREKASRYYLYK